MRPVGRSRRVPVGARDRTVAILPGSHSHGTSRMACRASERRDSGASELDGVRVLWTTNWYDGPVEGDGVSSPALPRLQ